MQIQNPFEIIIDRLNTIQTRVGDIDTIVRSGNLPPLRKKKKPWVQPKSISGQGTQIPDIKDCSHNNSKNNL